MGRRLVIEEDLTPGQELADAIISGQQRAIGDLAVVLANQVSGLVYDDEGPPQLHGDEVAILDALVREYSAVSGAVGPRLCFMAAEPVLREHPQLRLPAFAELHAGEMDTQRANGGAGAPQRKRKRWFGIG